MNFPALKKGNAKTVLFCLPAFPTDSTLFKSLGALVSDFQVLSLDYPGLGGTALASEPVYTMEWLAAKALSVLDAAQISSAAWLGVSMGGYVALSVMDQAPQRVHALILADTRAEADPPDMAAQRRQTVQRLRTEGAGFLKERFAQMVAPQFKQGHPERLFEFQSRIDTMNPEALARLSLGLAARKDRTGLLSSIQVPTLVIGGELDTISPPSQMRALAARLPQAKFFQVPEAGHLPPLEQPEIFAHCVEEFLAAWPVTDPPADGGNKEHK
jgi:3-oxoadipate enol-lactonase